MLCGWNVHVCWHKFMLTQYRCPHILGTLHTLYRGVALKIEVVWLAILSIGGGTGYRRQEQPGLPTRFSINAQTLFTK